MRRRKLLAASAAGLSLIAGCSDSGTDTDTPGGAEDTPTPTPEPTPTPTESPTPSPTAATDSEAPSAPSDLSVERDGGTLLVTWGESSDSGSGVAEYVVMMNGEEARRTGSAFAQITEFDLNTTHEFEVYAVDEAGNESGTATTSIELDAPWDVIAPKTSSAPTIDGDLSDGEWETSLEVPVDNVLSGIGAPADESDLSATGYVTFDDSALYVGVDVTDDLISGDAGSTYMNDNVEIYLDTGGQSSSEDYGSNAAQYRFLAYEPEEYGGGKNSSESAVEWAFSETDDGYNLEAKYELSDVGQGDTVGFELHVTDNDDEGTRTAKLAWMNEEDNAYGDRGSWGHIRLGEQ